MNLKTYTFNYTGNYQVFTVPKSGIYLIESWGAAGGDSTVASGGKGGYAKGELRLNAGEVLYVYVGGTTTSYQGGFNGGGIVQNSTYSNTGGGGASDVRTKTTDLSTRLIVAGGGGGAALNGGPNTGHIGGYGGGSVGGDGNGHQFAAKDGGKGGTQKSGGDGGWYGSGYSAGSPGQLGVGGYGIHGGGGGGGGFFGGGGGSWGGGGGGSSYLGSLINSSTQSGVRTGNGLILIHSLKSGPTKPGSIVDIEKGQRVLVNEELYLRWGASLDGEGTPDVSYAIDVYDGSKWQRIKNNIRETEATVRISKEIMNTSNVSKVKLRVIALDSEEMESEGTESEEFNLIKFLVIIQNKHENMDLKDNILRQ